MFSLSCKRMVLKYTKHAAMREEECRVIKTENVALLLNQYCALRAGLPFISGLLFAARAPFFMTAVRDKRNHVLSRSRVLECRQSWLSSRDGKLFC